MALNVETRNFVMMSCWELVCVAEMVTGSEVKELGRLEVDIKKAYNDFNRNGMKILLSIDAYKTSNL